MFVRNCEIVTGISEVHSCIFFSEYRFIYITGKTKKRYRLFLIFLKVVFKKN